MLTSVFSLLHMPVTSAVIHNTLLPSHTTGLDIPFYSTGADACWQNVQQSWKDVGMCSPHLTPPADISTYAGDVIYT